MKLILKIIILVVVVVLGWSVWQLYTPASLAKEDVNFEIASGEGVNQISINLHEEGLIKSKFIFETYIWALGAEGKIIAGNYDLNTGMNIPELSKVIMGGSDNEDERLTFIEGWNRNDYASYLTSKGFDGDRFLDLTDNVANWKSEYDFLRTAPNSATLEGFLYPDTYNVSQFTTEEVLINRLLLNFERRVDAEILAKDNLFELVTLASIVENEVHQEEHRKGVAGIFWNRLEAGIGLQSDATVNFVTGKSDRRPLLEDLEIDSPYNTYKYRGLPPGPIANPSISSLRAVNDPEDHDYLYFLNNKAGEIFYAADFEGHQRNRELYLD